MLDGGRRAGAGLSIAPWTALSSVRGCIREGHPLVTGSRVWWSGPDLGVGVLESAFTASEAATASLGFRRSAAEVHPSTPGGRAIVHERLGRPRRAIPRLTDTQVTSVQFFSIQLFDGQRHGGSIIELDEREAARPVGGPVDRKKDLFDWPRFREEGLEVSLGRFVAKVPDEYSRRNGEPPLSSAGPRPPVAGQTPNV